MKLMIRTASLALMLVFTMAACGEDTPATDTHVHDSHDDHDGHDDHDTTTPPADTTTPPEDTTTPPEDTTTPPGDTAQPSICEYYCGLAIGNCTGDNAIYDDMGACMAACPAIASNADWDMANPVDEDSVECRITYLHKAKDDPTQCAAGAADGGCVCINVTTPEPSGLAYSFPSKFAPFTGKEAAWYNGQSMRQVLIEDLKATIGSLTGKIDDGSMEPTENGEVVELFTFYFDFDADSDGGEAFMLTTDPAPHQKTWAEIGTKNLKGKFAGNDSKTDHKDWSKEFKGWTDAGVAANGGDVTTPFGLLTAFFETLEENAIGRAAGNKRFGVDGMGNALTDPLPVHVTAGGHDLQQLVQKFLTMAVNFSQGTDDYLDDDIDGKGILVANTRDGCKPYSKLAHHWDEGFGYYGAARDNDAYKACDIAGKCKDDPAYIGKYNDSNGDGSIDLTAEYNFGHSQNAAKRTYGSTTKKVDFKKDVFDHFVAGRKLINDAGDALTDDELKKLQEHRDVIVMGWEKAVAATAVHYINDTLGDMAKFGTMDYSFTTHAKHWSELKGFALGLQFNPRSPLSSEKFVEFHNLIGDAPVLPNADQTVIDQYKADLEKARAIFETAYGFENDDVVNW